MTNPIKSATAMAMPHKLDTVQVLYEGEAGLISTFVCPPGTGTEIAARLMRPSDALPLDFKAFGPGTIMIDETPTLRDRFAMAALPAILDNEWGQSREGHGDAWCAEAAYALADRMLAARAREGKP